MEVEEASYFDPGLCLARDLNIDKDGIPSVQKANFSFIPQKNRMNVQFAFFYTRDAANKMIQTSHPEIGTKSLSVSASMSLANRWLWGETLHGSSFSCSLRTASISASEELNGKPENINSHFKCLYTFTEF